MIIIRTQLKQASDKILARWDLEYFLQCTICQNLWICINYNLRGEREEKMAYNTSLSFLQEWDGWGGTIRRSKYGKRTWDGHSLKLFFWVAWKSTDFLQLAI